MANQLLHLKEWDQLTLATDDEQTRAWILALQKRHIIETELSSQGIVLRSKSYVGFEANDRYRLEISPKIPNVSIMKMVGFVHGFIPVMDEVSAKLGESENTLKDLLIFQWLEFVRKLTPRLRQNYVQIRNDELYIKGKINFKELSKKGIVTARTPIEYSVLKLDQFLNQLIKAGLVLLQGETSNPFLSNQIQLLLRDYISISDIQMTIRLLEQAIAGLTRIEMDYQVPLSYLKWLLELSGTASGENVGKGFWLDMNSLFQAYVTKFFRVYAQELTFHSEVSIRNIFEYKKESNPLGRRAISIRPDLQVTSGSTLTHIIDFKYKDLVKHAVGTADLYQLSNYGLSLGQGELNPIILYPTVDEYEDQVIEVNIPILKKKQEIIVRGVDLNFLESKIELNDFTKLRQYAFKLLAP